MTTEAAFPSILDSHDGDATVSTATRIFDLWSAQATPFSVFALRPDAAATARIAAVRQSLTDAGIGHVIPSEFLHVTVQSLGNLGEGGLTGQIADELGAAVTGALAECAPFSVVLGAVNTFHGAAFIEVHEASDGAPLHAMQRAVVDALVAANWVPVRHPERPYVPHLSICYYDRDYSVRQVADALSSHRSETFGSLRVDAIELVRIVGNGTPYPPMETVRRIPLGGA